MMKTIGKIGLAIAGALTVAYLGTGLYGPRTQEAREDLEPVWSEFEQIVNNTEPKLQRQEVPGEKRAYTLDYGGAIDEVLYKRDEVLNEHGVIGIGGWRVTDAGWGEYAAHNNLIVFDPNPFD